MVTIFPQKNQQALTSTLTKSPGGAMAPASPSSPPDPCRGKNRASLHKKTSVLVQAKWKMCFTIVHNDNSANFSSYNIKTRQKRSVVLPKMFSVKGHTSNYSGAVFLWHHSWSVAKRRVGLPNQGLVQKGFFYLLASMTRRSYWSSRSKISLQSKEVH